MREDQIVKSQTSSFCCFKRTVKRTNCADHTINFFVASSSKARLWFCCIVQSDEEIFGKANIHPTALSTVLNEYRAIFHLLGMGSRWGLKAQKELPEVVLNEFQVFQCLFACNSASWSWSLLIYRIGKSSWIRVELPLGCVVYSLGNWAILPPLWLFEKPPR